jgi:hypothetical protein
MTNQVTLKDLIGKYAWVGRYTWKVAKGKSKDHVTLTCVIPIGGRSHRQLRKSVRDDMLVTEATKWDYDRQQLVGAPPQKREKP